MKESSADRVASSANPQRDIFDVAHPRIDHLFFIIAGKEAKSGRVGLAVSTLYMVV